MIKKQLVEIPEDVAARVLFLSGRTCGVNQVVETEKQPLQPANDLICCTVDSNASAKDTTHNTGS